MTPVTGRIVRYTLTDEDARAIAARREWIPPGGRTDEPARYASGGNGVGAGQEFPAMVVGVSGGEVDLQVFLDGNDVLWAADAPEGDGPGCWAQREPPDLPGLSPDPLNLSPEQIREVARQVQASLPEQAKRSPRTGITLPGH